MSTHAAGDPLAIPDLIHDLAEVYRRIDRLLERAYTDSGWIFVQREIIEKPRLFVPPSHIERLIDHYKEAGEPNREALGAGLLPCADVPSLRALISEAVDLFLEQLAADGSTVAGCVDSGFSSRYVASLDAIRDEWRQTCAERIEALRLESRRLQLESLAHGKQATTATPKDAPPKHPDLVTVAQILKAIQAALKNGETPPCRTTVKGWLHKAGLFPVAKTEGEGRPADLYPVDEAIKAVADRVCAFIKKANPSRRITPKRASEKLAANLKPEKYGESLAGR